MRDIVFSAPDYDALLADAERLGFTYDDEGVTRIKTSGLSPSGGNWFLNIVGTVYEPASPPKFTVVDGVSVPVFAAPKSRSGYWGRLRINTEAKQAPPFADTIIQYEYDVDLGGWTSDGTTVAPEWVSLVGLIA
jgi:hypothetical protein